MQPAVLVVGGGPVGLTMAAELARFGVPTRIIEKSPQRTDKSKALVLWARTLELLDRAGATGPFIEAGFNVKAANIVAGAKPIAHVRLDEIQTPYPYALMLPQSDTERLLEAHLNTLGVQLERQVELLRFESNDDHIIATLGHTDGREEKLQIPWLIGCDGAHSTVRHALGMKFEGDTLLSDWILADLHLTGVLGEPDEIIIYWHADGMLVIFPITPGRYRVIADAGLANDDHPRPDPTLDEIRKMLDDRGPGGIVASDPIWLASFRINERKVKDYRAGRVFLAGDAAHVHSPAGGQGMNTGMQDACNLAWKLAMVHRGQANKSLLESYSIERSAVGEQVLKDAGHLTTIATLRGGITQGVRNHVASLLFGLSPVRHNLANKLAELSIGYAKSPLTISGSHGLPSPAPGERLPMTPNIRPIGGGDTPRFALFAKADAKSAEVIRRFSNLLEPEVRLPIDENGIWLVRPDGYVAVVAKQNDLTGIEKLLTGIESAN